MAVCLSLALSTMPAASGDPSQETSHRRVIRARTAPSRRRSRWTRRGPARTARPTTSAPSRPRSRWPTSGSRRPPPGPSRPPRPTTARCGGCPRPSAATVDARADAARARRTVIEQRRRIGELVALSYQNGGDLTALKAMMSADGPLGVLDQYAAFQGASTSLQADYKRFAAAESLAKVFEAKAKAAKAEQVRLAAAARQARQRGRRVRRGGPGGCQRRSRPRGTSSSASSPAPSTSPSPSPAAGRRPSRRSPASAPRSEPAVPRWPPRAPRPARRRRLPPRHAGRPPHPAPRRAAAAARAAPVGSRRRLRPRRPRPHPHRRPAVARARPSGSRRHRSASPTSGAPPAPAPGTAPA